MKKDELIAILKKEPFIDVNAKIRPDHIIREVVRHMDKEDPDRIKSVTETVQHAIGEAFQITGDEILTWNQIYETIADALGVKLHPYHVATDFLVRAGKPLNYDFEGGLTGDKSVSVVFNNRKIKRIAPDMKTNIPFSQGVRIALDYILSHPEECQTEDPEFDEWCDKVIGAVEKALEELE